MLIVFKGTIILTEPEKTNFLILKENVKLNNMNYIILINKAFYYESNINLSVSENDVFARIDKIGNDNFIKGITFNEIVLEYNLKSTIMKWILRVQKSIHWNN